MNGGRTARKVGGGGLAPWQVELASRLLLRDLCTAFPISQLAGLCGLSRGYFIKAFKASTGMTPHRWLVRQRILHAVELLERTDERISVIASTSGFSDQSHLTRTFRAMLGISPAVWRRRCRAMTHLAPTPSAPFQLVHSSHNRRAEIGCV